MKSSSIKVGARTYTVICLINADFDFLLAQKRVWDSDIKSFIDYDEQLIAVRASLTSDHQHELILHELLHAMLADSGVKQNDVSEELIAVMAPRLNHLLSSGLIEVMNKL